MQIREIHGFNALCNAKGVEREVNLFLLGEGAVKPGDYVIVHVGYAIQKMSEEEARSTWELLDEMLALEGDDAPPAPPRNR
jgi:hydrogenase expression/formation protein HypC